MLDIIREPGFKRRKHPLITLAEPFYKATGYEIPDQVSMWSLENWEAVRFRRFRGRFPDMPETMCVDLVPHSLFRFMLQHTFSEHDEMRRAFRAAERAGLENAEAVRRASTEELMRLGKNIGFFLAEGLGRIIEGKIVTEQSSRDYSLMKV